MGTMNRAISTSRTHIFVVAFLILSRGSRRTVDPFSKIPPFQKRCCPKVFVPVVKWEAAKTSSDLPSPPRPAPPPESRTYGFCLWDRAEDGDSTLKGATAPVLAPYGFPNALPGPWGDGGHKIVYRPRRTVTLNKKELGSSAGDCGKAKTVGSVFADFSVKIVNP